MSADARIYALVDEAGNLSLGGNWALAEVKGIGANSVFEATDAIGLALPANAKRKSALLLNNGATSVYLCTTSGDDATTGFPLAPGAVFFDNITYGDWYAICDSENTTELRIIEVSTT